MGRQDGPVAAAVGQAEMSRAHLRCTLLPLKHQFCTLEESLTLCRYESRNITDRYMYVPISSKRTQGRGWTAPWLRSAGAADATSATLRLFHSPRLLAVHPCRFTGRRALPAIIAHAASPMTNRSFSSRSELETLSKDELIEMLLKTNGVPKVDAEAVPVAAGAPPSKKQRRQERTFDMSRHAQRHVAPVSYTHLTLPTILLV